MKTDVNGVANIAPGKEQFEDFESRRGPRVQYDYRHTDGRLFSCVAKTLADARDKRDAWLAQRLEVIQIPVPADTYTVAELAILSNHLASMVVMINRDLPDDVNVFSATFSGRTDSFVFRFNMKENPEVRAIVSAQRISGTWVPTVSFSHKLDHPQVTQLAKAVALATTVIREILPQSKLSNDVDS